MKNKEDYNIGLDIGVASIGWCVTDSNNTILKKNGKNMWGSRIFTEAQTAEKRREFRGNKRRINRRKERIRILQDIMKEDLEKENANFLPMLRESSLNFEDKINSQKILGIKYNLFSDNEMTDASYYKQFPTIYHLRNYLINITEKVDIRLVYLAIHHIIKYRGNFLYDGDFSNNTQEINEKFETILMYLQDKFGISLKSNNKDIFEILKQKNISKANKRDKLLLCFDYEKEAKQAIVNIIKSFLGNEFDLAKIFRIEIEKLEISFLKDIQNEDEIKDLLQEDSAIYDAMHTIYSWYMLQDILKGNTYISKSFIEKYDKYSKDLTLLKNIYKKYFKNEYASMFRNVNTNNYVVYNGKSGDKTYKKCKTEDFFVTLKKKILELPDVCEEKNYILNEIDDNNFLRKINVTDNGAIPHQLHQKELEIILNNQSQYYKTIKENKDKIIQLFSFRIPYYIGPLAKENSKWAWIVRKSDEQIRPWNFDIIVDEDATAEEFIKRMTNKCTYILNENVMPKQSLLYSKYCVLNELNNIRIDNHHIAKDMKNKIIEKLFKVKKKVTIDMLKNLLKQEGLPYNNITGLTDSTNFNSNMTSYIDLEKILGKIDESNYEQCENIIYWITIFEEKKILKRKIKKEYPNLSEEQIDKLSKLKYTGWSRLSKKLIVGLKANDGETIIEKLERTNLNFMQIISNKEFGYDKQLTELMPKISKKVQYKDIEEIPTSPANKRSIWQCICIVKEITKIMKSEPHNIYIEFARSEDKKIMKDNRAKQLLKKYENIQKQVNYLKEYDNNVYKELKSHESDKILTEKLYLYFIQNGKCMYSGKPLNIDELDKYEVDHILPQSYIKDDSIDNKAIVIRSENQRKKDSLLLSDEIINARQEWWKDLLDKGLISQTKYYRLIRRKMFETDNDVDKFIQRQLVETRQITKFVTNLLLNQYTNSQVYALRAELTHNFRITYNIYKNRNVNNYHHAHDAYILSVIGNILSKDWKNKEQFKYSTYVKKYLKDNKTKEEKTGMIMNFINKRANIEKVKKTINYKDCFLSRMLEEGTGEFYNQTLYSPKDKPVIALKNNKSPIKYGGYSNEYKAYFVIYEYINKKNQQEYQLVGIPIQVAYDIKSKKIKLEDYIINKYLTNIQYSNFKILKRKILKNQEYLDNNNQLMRFCSDTEIRSNKELIVNETMTELIYLMNKQEDKLDDAEKNKVEKNYEYMFNYLLNKLNKEYKCFITIYDKLKYKLNLFNTLEEKDKKSTINGLIELMKTGQGNLKSIKLSDREGRKANQTFKTDKLLNITFIDKSVTGMYERRYRINGMENNSSK